jgi:hypothetical protein
MKKLFLIVFLSVTIIGCNDNHEKRITELEEQVNRLATLTNSGFEATYKNDSIINKRIDLWSDKVVDLSQCMLKNCR